MGKRKQGKRSSKRTRRLESASTKAAVRMDLATASDAESPRRLMDDAEKVYDGWPFPNASWPWEEASGYGHYRNWGDDATYLEGLESSTNSTIYTDKGIQNRPEMQYFFRRQIQCQGIPKMFDLDEFGSFSPRYENCMSHTKEIDGVNKVKKWNAKCSWAICKR